MFDKTSLRTGRMLLCGLLLMGMAPGHASTASCEYMDSGEVRPQYMRDRMPECGGTAPKSARAKAIVGGTLTTFFASNNGGNNTGGVYFDLEALGPDVQISAWDTNLAAGWQGDVSIWWRNGSHSGAETSPAGWTLIGTANGITSAGSDVPTAINVGPHTIPGGATHGIAITLNPTGPGGGHSYTNGTGANQVFNDGVLELRAGSANNVSFAAGLFSPRVWNGTIQYSYDNAAAPAAVPVLGPGGLALLSLLFAGLAARGRLRME